MSGCPRCQRPFSVGDELILIVTQLLEGDKLEYVPAHLLCPSPLTPQDDPYRTSITRQTEPHK